MKFLHLADLHIGKTVNNYSMLEDQRHVFGQIMACIEAERPDAVLIAGDVYDRAVPGVEAVRLFDDFLTGLAKQDVAVILIAGNHDSPERLSYASRLLQEQKLHLCGQLEGPLKAVTLPDAFGEVKVWMLPFVKPGGLRALYPDRQIESYADAVRVALKETPIDYGQRNVLLSHQFYTAAGVTSIRSESELNPVGGLDAVDAGLLAGFDYVALGHLHGPQAVGNSVRYAGSPLKYSFSEWRQTKSLTLVELGEKGDVRLRELPIHPLRDLREIRGPLERLLSAEVSAQGNREDYLRVVLTDEEELIDPMGKLRAVYPHVMSLDFEKERGNQADSAVMELEALEALSPYELFSQFFLERSGSAMSREQALIVRELMEKEGQP